MIGRRRELEILEECKAANRSRLVVVYGRRRVGKTFLVREAFGYRFTFTHTGLEKGSFREQLTAFWNELRRQCGTERPAPLNWMEAFEALKDALAAAYMVFGGAPYYWSLLDGGGSLSQNVDRLFFAPGAELADEFSRLFRSVFSSPEPHVAVVEALGRKKAGMTREELAAAVPGAANDGTLTAILRNLETSGFVRRYVETGNVRKGSVFQLVDNYVLFHFQFVKGYAGHDPARWSHLARDARRTTWEGLAFERVCLQHSAQIKAALGIAGVETDESAWRCVSRDPDVKGAQIDLVIRRADRVVNLCEMKFCSEKFAIDAAYAEKLREKIGAFKRETGTRDNCHLTFVTTYGLRRNPHSSMVQSVVTLDDLFRDA